MMLPQYIKTPEDWWAYAKAVVAAMPDYSYNHRGWDQQLGEKLLAEQDHKALHAHFERTWELLPDSPGIHEYPFGLLCDCCSEYWVFEEDPTS